MGVCGSGDFGWCGLPGGCVAEMEHMYTWSQRMQLQLKLGGECVVIVHVVICGCVVLA